MPRSRLTAPWRGCRKDRKNLRSLRARGNDEAESHAPPRGECAAMPHLRLRLLSRTRTGHGLCVCLCFERGLGANAAQCRSSWTVSPMTFRSLRRRGTSASPVAMLRSMSSRLIVNPSTRTWLAAAQTTARSTRRCSSRAPGSSDTVRSGTTSPRRVAGVDSLSTDRGGRAVQRQRRRRPLRAVRRLRQDRARDAWSVQAFPQAA